MTGAAVAAPAPPHRGEWVLRLLLGAAVALLLAVTAAAPGALPFVPPFLLAVAASVALARRPGIALYVVLAAFVLIVDRRAGIQPREVVFGLAYAAFLAVWYVHRVFLTRDRLLVTRVDLALGVFLAYAAASVGLTVLFDGDVRAMIGEAIPISMLALYFPVREAVRRSPRAAIAVMAIVAGLALFAGLRNFVSFRFYMLLISDAEQIAGARIIANEVLFLYATIGAIVFLLHADRWRGRLLAGAAFLFFLFSLIVTGSRGYWVAFGLGVSVLFVLLDRGRRTRLAALGLAAFVALVGAGTLLMGGEMFAEYARGLVERVVSIGTAAVDDRSLVTRWVETAAVWARVLHNPVLGYGMGVNYQYLNLFALTTFDHAFLHNGYLALWYKFGLVGGISMLVFWLGSAWHGAGLYRRAAAPKLIRLAGLTAAACLVAEMPVAITSNPFAIEDAMLMLTLAAAVVAGSRDGAAGVGRYVTEGQGRER